MIISGKNSVFEALNSSITVNRVVIASSIHDDFSKKIVDLCKQKHIRLDFDDKFHMDKLADHNQGYVAYVTEFEYSTVKDILSSKKESGNFIVILDGVEDPHNFGSIIRVCECVGVDGIIIEQRRSCPVNETVYKTSCGAVSFMKIAKVTNINDEIRKLKEQNVWVYCAEAGGKDIFSTSLTGNIALVMGSEGEGVGKLTKKLCDGIISLPMFGKINSLNVSTATCAIVYEALRQRGK
ncbi:MAG: 23S rRNA (guanosine(2251)-2'-O)-methyltransferase RlmB [Clostridia bacterium]|nr:23S rRNA (guanosine(2251)-2'-O)-methyltransferase RlmB [Clostridia bacterium]